MADYGSNNDRGYTLLLRVEETGTSTGQNTSTVRVQLWLKNGYTTFGMYDCRASVSINGQTLSWSGRPDMYTVHSSLHLLDRTITILHDSNGSKTIGFSATFSGSGGWSPGTLQTGQQTLRLTNIPRASSATVSGNRIGEVITIAIKRASPDFTHQLTWHFGNASGTIGTSIATSATWTPSIAQLAPQIPTSTSGTGQLKLSTVYGGKVIGSITIPITLHLPSSVIPSLGSISVTESHAVAKTFLTKGYFAQLVSNPQVLFHQETGSYGSTIPSSGYRAEVFKFDNHQWVQLPNITTEKNGLLGGINWIGRIKVSAYVTDSRGRQSERKEVELTLLEYFQPIFSFSAIRTGSGMNQINVIRKLKIAPLAIQGVQKNRATIRWEVVDLATNQKQTNIGGDADWTSTTESIKTDFQATLGGVYDTTKSYRIMGTLSDIFYSTSFEFTVGPETVVYGLSPFGMGIGKAWTRGVLDVDGSLPAYFDGEIYMKNQKLIDIFYPIGTIYESTAAASPATFMGGTWERFGNGRVLVGVSEKESEFNTVNKTGGSKTHTLTISEMPAHSHAQYVTANSGNQAVRRDYSSDGKSGIYPQGNNTGNTGGGHPHNNLQPYVTVYRWRRTA